MAGRIPQDFIDDLLSRTDIVDIVEERVKLRRSGRNYSGLCPFHQEKTPSFTVDPDKQFYYCFGCGAGGNALSFLMEYERFDFPQAVEALARRQGLEIPREEGEQERRQNRRPLMDLLRRASDFYRAQLKSHPGRTTAVNYLKQRGLSGEIAREYGIGFAPPGWDNLLKHLGDDPDTRSMLDAAGLIVQKNDGARCYDRFRNRIIFPIHDMRGEVIAFGGRVLSSEDSPKYLNSPETEVFHKGRELYGLYQARRANRTLERLVIVEGYMDVVALAQFGIRNAVATLGTATSAQHLERLFRLTGEVVFCFDGDAAGRKAARRALETVLPLMEDNRQARFLFLPEGEDPDSLVRKEGAEGFTQRLNAAAPLSQYLFDQLQEGLDLMTAEGRSRLSAAALPLIDRIPGRTLAALLRQRLGELTGLDADFFAAEEPIPEAASPAPATEKIPAPPLADRPRPQQQPQPPQPTTTGIRPSSLTARAISRLLRYPWLARNVDFETTDALAALGEPELELLRALIEQARKQPDQPSVLLVSRWRNSPHFGLLKQLAEREALILDHGLLEEEFRACLRQLLRRAEERRLDELKSRKPSQLSEEERKQLTRLLLSHAQRR